MRICVISANLGKIDGDVPPRWINQVLPQNWTVDYFLYNSSNTVLRSSALHPRLQAKIYRMMGWEMHPGYDYYIWLDAAFDVRSLDFITWMVNSCGNHDIVMFPHSRNKNISEEAAAVLGGIKNKDQYLIDRYATEPIKEQLEHYLKTEKHTDDFLIETGAFCYRPTNSIKAMMKDWLYECCRWSVEDQISLPVVIRRNKVDLELFPLNIFNNGRIEHTWHQRK